MSDSISRKKPWNRLNLPIYSVASHDGKAHNMNICTYASQVSMKPKRYVVAIYKGTKTLQNVEAVPRFVLQVLSTEHIDLVTRLGKQSGMKKDKLKPINDRLDDYCGFKILKDAVAVIEMDVLRLTDDGDHLLALCDVVSYKNISDSAVLMLDHLRENKLISI
jgi:flavin reductase (DIM6/NTAB) family NADH-FMN oxidoreductase RutF